MNVFVFEDEWIRVGVRQIVFIRIKEVFEDEIYCRWRESLNK